MKKINVLCASVILVIAMGGCVSSGKAGVKKGGMAPEWFTDKDSIYPQSQYLAELGEGDSLRDAKANAAGSIAQIFSTRIQLDSTIKTLYQELSGGDSLEITQETSVDQSVKQSADESLINLRYGESWIDRMGRIYVLAYLNRLETGHLYQQRITENDERVVSLMARANAQNENFRCFALTNTAYAHAETNRALLEQLEIISMPMTRTMQRPYDMGALQAEREDLAAKLRFAIEVSGNMRLSAVLKEWLSQQGFTMSDDANMFLSATVSMKPVELSNNYENLSWELNLTMLDSSGSQVISLSRQGRSSGISVSAAETRMMADMVRFIQKDFDREFQLLTFVDK